MLLHIGGFQLDTDSPHTTPWHRLAPHTRILCAVLLVLAIALTPNGRWSTWGIYALGIAGLVWLSRVRLPVLLKRLVVESAFVGVVLLGTLFRGGGEVLWQWGWLQITREGLVILGSVVCKALLSLVVMNLLTMTTPIPLLLQGMARLRVPPLLVSIMAAMSRYMGVLVAEFDSMKRAALSRNLMNHPRHTRLIVGNMIGSLFIRSVDRGDRIHQSMLSRGYTGLPPVADFPRGSRRDAIALTATLLLALLGQTV